MSKFLTKLEAAKRLGTSERTIFRLLDRGLLRPAKEGRRIGVLEADVVLYAQAKNTATEDRPAAPDREACDLLMARVRALEVRLGIVERILNIHHPPLGLTACELVGLYKTVADYAEVGWSPHVEQMLADTFLRLMYEDLVQLRELVDDPLPWRPFLKLASTLKLACYDPELRDQFDLGRAHLVGLAMVYGQLAGTTVKQTDLQVREAGRPRGHLVRRLQRVQEAADTTKPSILATVAAEIPA
jgi:excisionase family DNA binding protein